MDLLQTSLMGVVQGLSEFLPVSSSGHLVLTSALYKTFTGVSLELHSNQEVFLDIMLHLGTLVAVLIFFKREIKNICTALVVGLKTKDYSDNNAKIGLFIIIGTIFTLLVAYPLKEISEKLVNSPAIVGLLLIITGLYMLIAELYSKKISKKNNESGLTLKNTIFIGIAQGLAAFPGFSRSGWTISTGLFAGLDRLTSARYSFLLSIPIILGTSLVYPLVEIDYNEIVTYNWVAIITGTVISGITGYFCIKYFLKFLAKFSLSVFAYYCIIIGLTMAIFFRHTI